MHQYKPINIIAQYGLQACKPMEYTNWTFSLPAPMLAELRARREKIGVPIARQIQLALEKAGYGKALGGGR
ncbi:hypothetical protein AUJ14_00965 [Candidatus Micrarchaeota archaeon CG1_02_55_22]|nr:MAG: hypothetical protein AUJ14_00965 [Candidatus Micrarchaeota archaeon CG1_02_55_22]